MILHWQRGSGSDEVLESTFRFLVAPSLQRASMEPIFKQRKAPESLVDKEQRMLLRECSQAWTCTILAKTSWSSEGRNTKASQLECGHFIHPALQLWPIKVQCRERIQF